MRERDELARQCVELRNQVLDMVHVAGSGHCGGSLSAIEILWTLYSRVLRVRPDDPQWADRDRFILSKGHAAPTLYAVLARRGFFDAAALGTLRRAGSILQGHPDMGKTPGVEISTGSLGMGISAGLGMALGARLAGKRFRVYVLVGDGELQEGQNWEALMAASKYGLDNFTIIVDRNGVQLDGPVDRIMPLGDLDAKLRAFGCDVYACDGHDCGALLDAFRKAGASADLGRAATTAAGQPGRPKAIIAHTVKGKGVSFMEGQAAWHGKPLLADDYQRAKGELAASAAPGEAD
jgi:transketolase